MSETKRQPTVYVPPSRHVHVVDLSKLVAERLAKVKRKPR